MPKRTQRPIAEFVRRRLAASVAGFAAMSLGMASPGYSQVHHPAQYFDIPAQGASDALNAFSKQSGLRLLFSFDQVEGRRVQAIRGKFSAEDVLAQLLDGSGLVYEITADSVVLIRDPAAPDARTSRAEAVDRRYDVSGSSADMTPIVLAQADTSGAAPAGGQSSDEPSHGEDELTEIIVTAQKRAQSAIEVPISLSVFGETELEALRVQSVEDFAFNVPNLTYTNFGTLEGPDISIRGISQFGGSVFDPLGVTVDGMSFGATDSSAILTARFFDYERVEVLRGPQGTLSGRGAMGGSLNIVSVQPSAQELEVKGTLDISRFDTSLVKGVLNVPLSEQFAIRTVGYREQSDGALRNIGPGGKDTGYENYGGRLAARWWPTDRLTVDFGVGYEKLFTGQDAEMPVDVYFEPRIRAERIALIESLGGDYFSTPFFTDPGVGNNGGRISLDTLNDAHVRHVLLQFKTAYRLDSHNLEFLFGRFDRKGDSQFDADRSEFARFRDWSRGTSKANSFEVRATSAYTGTFNWVAGVSYLDEKNLSRGARDIGDDLAGGSYPELNQAPATSLIDIGSWGFYANAFWDFADRWHLSAGGRLSRDKTGIGDITSLGSVTSDDMTRISLTSFDPRVALNFDFADNATAYVQFATGYRSGFGNPARAVDLGLAPATVSEERLKNYEIGVKGRFLDNRVEVTADAFFMDYTDLQVGGYTYIDEQTIYYSANAGEASARGFELEVNARPTDRWRFSAGVGYVDSKLSSGTLIQWFGETVDDPTIPNTKPWTVNATLQYKRPLWNGLDGGFRIDHRRQSHSYEDFAQNQADMNNAFDLTDVTLDIGNDRWSLSAYFENVFDKTYWLANSTGSSLHGTFVAFIPRTYGLRFNMNFRSPRN